MRIRMRSKRHRAILQPHRKVHDVRYTFDMTPAVVRWRHFVLSPLYSIDEIRYIHV
jgi:hypothetical protein